MLNFNSIYWFYDLLARLVFGKRLEMAKATFLNRIENNSKILIIAGGTGSTLKYLDKNKNKLNIDFVEVSSGMISKAKCRTTQNLEINFYEKAIEEFNGSNYDFIVTEFFFDMFTPSKVEELVAQIKPKLNSNGKWIDTDFRNTDLLRHKFLLWIMYLFFKVTVNLKVNHICDTNSVFNRHGLHAKNEVSFNNGFITSRIFAGN